jgi:hypothetical protein
MFVSLKGLNWGFLAWRDRKLFIRDKYFIWHRYRPITCVQNFSELLQNYFNCEKYLKIKKLCSAFRSNLVKNSEKLMLFNLFLSIFHNTFVFCLCMYVRNLNVFSLFDLMSGVPLNNSAGQKEKSHWSLF